MTIAGETTEAIFNQHGTMYIKYKNEVDEMARCICTEKTLKCVKRRLFKIEKDIEFSTPVVASSSNVF